MALRSGFIFAVSAVVVFAACGGSAISANPNADGDAMDASSPPNGDGGTAPIHGGDAGGPLDDGSTIDLSSDPKNCGALGHDCLGPSCASGLCAPEIVRTGVGLFVVDGTNIYFFTSATALSVTTTADASKTTAVATLDSACVATSNRLFVTPSYVVLECPKEIQTVKKSSGAIATISFTSTNAPFSTAVGDDSTLYYYDDNPYIWAVPTAGGTPTMVFDNWIPSAMTQTGDGMLAVVSDGVGEASGLYHFTNGGTDPTFVADTPSSSMAAGLVANASLAFGSVQDEGDANICETSGHTSTFWSAPRTGGTDKIIATLPFRTGKMLADASGVVISEGCQNISGTIATGDRNVWRAPLKSTDTPLLLARANAEFDQIGIDSKYVYFTVKGGADIARVAR